MPINFDIKKYSKNKKVYIETGFFKGESTEIAFKADFEEIHSCDINEVFLEEGRKKFSHEVLNKKLFLHFGRSTDVLEKILQDLNNEAVFFLDAHDITYKGTETEKWNEQDACPIMLELNLIKEHKIKNHTIIIDDIRMFSYGCTPGTWAYEKSITPKHLYNKLKEINKDYHITLEDGICERDVMIAYIRE